ncbi:MAG: hypothetical protein J7M38_10200 [Armatimonadetes bacterium]|nr:hypothetical protein [Armatimonadota bacterium]
MNLKTTKRFWRDYWKLPETVRKQADRKFAYLAQNIEHPSLRVKRIRGYSDIYEGSINMQYRFAFKITTDAYVLVRIGRHDILDKL